MLIYKKTGNIGAANKIMIQLRVGVNMHKNATNAIAKQIHCTFDKIFANH